MGLYGFQNIEDARVLKQIAQERRIGQGHTRRIIRYPSVIGSGGGADANLAVTTEIIPARSGATPGGPITVTKQVVNSTSGDLEDGDTVEVYSWVQTDSPDPADQTDNKLRIWIEEDEAGIWWYTAVDCTPPPPAYETPSSGDTITSDSSIFYVGD